MASLLLLDVSGAFDNVSHRRLIHNLRKRRVAPLIGRWVESFIQGRKTTIRLPEYASDEIQTNTGIPQGSSISPILYLYYYADLVEVTTDPEMGTTTSGYIDDVVILAIGRSAEYNCTVLAEIH